MGNFSVGVMKSTVSPDSLRNFASVEMPAKVPLPRVIFSGVDVMKRRCMRNGLWHQQRTYPHRLARSLITKRGERAIDASQRTRLFARLAQVPRGAQNACSG